jgi:hypothetical protein
MAEASRSVSVLSQLSGSKWCIQQLPCFGNKIDKQHWKQLEQLDNQLPQFFPLYSLYSFVHAC